MFLFSELIQNNVKVQWLEVCILQALLEHWNSGAAAQGRAFDFPSSVSVCEGVLCLGGVATKSGDFCNSFPYKLLSSSLILLLPHSENRTAKWVPLTFPTWIVIEIQGKLLPVSLGGLKKILISDEQLRNSKHQWGSELDINPSRHVVEFSWNNRFTLFCLFRPGYQLNRHFDRSELHILASRNTYLINGC